MRVARRWYLLVLSVALLSSAPARGHELARRWVIGPEAGGSLNGDQWVAGGFTRLDGVCLIGCFDHLSLAVHALGGFGGNYLTVRGSPRLAYTLWLGEPDTVGLSPAVGAGFIGFFPVGRFADFCDRTGLDECRAFRVGFEWGGTLRLWPVALGAMVGTGELPVVTLTATVQLPLWSKDR